MKKLMKVLCVFSPIVLAIVMCVCLIPTSLGSVKVSNKQNLDNSPVQIVYATDEDTGASSSSADYKGGSIFLEPYSEYNFRGGLITGHTNIYGGAIYVSGGATLNIYGGEISDNTATYGGAIYIESGGTCNIYGGVIKNNKSKNAPAIYVETEGVLNISNDAEIKDNLKIKKPVINFNKVKIGGGSNNSNVSAVELYTVKLGSYPQDYVSDELNVELQSAISNGQLEFLNDKIMETPKHLQRSYAYWKYLDGNMYVPFNVMAISGGGSQINGNYNYRNGDSIYTGQTAFFKVQPINWLVLNYESWESGEDDYLELFAQASLISCQFDGDTWEESYAREWLNSIFYNQVFTDEEKQFIKLSTIKNNIAGDVDGSGTDTRDYVYLRSTEEMSSGVFKSKVDAYSPRDGSATDFAIATYVSLFDQGEVTYYRNLLPGTFDYWTRTVGTNGNVYSFRLHESGSATSIRAYNGLRPAIRIQID